MKLIPCVFMLIVGCEISANGIAFQRPKQPLVTPIKVDTEVTTDDKIGNDLRCLIIEDVEQRGNLSSVQRAMLTGSNVRKFMNEHASKDTSGWPRFRVVDKTTRLTNEWSEIASRANPQPTIYPWLIMENGRRLSKPLPESWAELKSDLDTFAGVK